MSRIIDKLVKVSGGWENFLYQTLKEVCEKVGQNGFTGEGEDSIDEALEILKAYEETGAVDTGVDERKITPVPVIKTQATVEVEVDESHKSVEVSKSVPVLVPEPFHVKIRVDGEVGGAQGTLPMPLDFKIVNRDLLTITTKNGLHLGGGSIDGQVKGTDVSGHVLVAGKYRLVFKDATLGVALVHFEAAYSPEVAVVDDEAGETKAGVGAKVRSELEKKVDREVERRLDLLTKEKQSAGTEEGNLADGVKEIKQEDEKVKLEMGKRVQMAAVAEAEKKAVESKSEVKV